MPKYQWLKPFSSCQNVVVDARQKTKQTMIKFFQENRKYIENKLSRFIQNLKQKSRLKVTIGLAQ